MSEYNQRTQSGFECFWKVVKCCVSDWHTHDVCLLSLVTDLRSCNNPGWPANCLCTLEIDQKLHQIFSSLTLQVLLRLKKRFLGKMRNIQQ